MGSRRWNGSLNGIGCRSLRCGTGISGRGRSCSGGCGKSGKSGRKRTESLVMLMMMKLMMMRMNWRSLRTDALTTTAVRMLRSMRATGGCRWCSERRWKWMRNWRRSQSGTWRSPVVMMEWSSPRERIRGSWHSTSSSGGRRNSRIKTVTGGSGEFGRCAFSCTIPQNAVDTRNTGRCSVSAHSFKKKRNECDSLAAKKQIIWSTQTFSPFQFGNFVYNGMTF